MSGKREKGKRRLQARLLEAMKRHKADGLTHRTAALLALQEVSGQPPEACAAFIVELTKRHPRNWATDEAEEDE